MSVAVAIYFTELNKLYIYMPINISKFDLLSDGAHSMIQMQLIQPHSHTYILFKKQTHMHKHT